MIIKKMRCLITGHEWRAHHNKRFCYRCHKKQVINVYEPGKWRDVY